MYTTSDKCRCKNQITYRLFSEFLCYFDGFSLSDFWTSQDIISLSKLAYTISSVVLLPCKKKVHPRIKMKIWNEIKVYSIIPLTPPLIYIFILPQRTQLRRVAGSDGINKFKLKMMIHKIEFYAYLPKI